MKKKKGNKQIKRVRENIKQRYRAGFVLRLTYIYLKNTISHYSAIRSNYPL